MNENGRASTLVLGTVAAVAGVALVSYWLFGRTSQHSNEKQISRNVSDVLSDCYSKIHDLKERLSELHPVSMAG